jgi:hypothetical protein
MRLGLTISLLSLGVLAVCCAQGEANTTGGTGGGYGGGTGEAGPSTTGSTTTSSTTTSSHAATTGTTSTGTTSTTGKGTTTTGAGGSGGAGGTGAGAGGTSSTTTGAGGGTGGACAESPCQLVAPQCGCPAGEECSLVPSSGARYCATAGTLGAGDQCGAGMLCAAGEICIGIVGAMPAVSMCGAFCATDADCVSPGGLCLLTLSDAAGAMIPNAMVCTQNCDPITNTGCQVPGVSCQVLQEQMAPMAYLTGCQAAGAGMHGAICTTSADCAPTFGCFTSGGTEECLQYCDPNNPTCPNGTICEALANPQMQPIMIGNDEYGVCF